MSGPKTIPGQQAPANATAFEAERRRKKESTAGLLSCFTHHLCVKALWLGVLQLAARIEMSDKAECALTLFSHILAVADIASQISSLLCDVDSRARSFRLGAGASLTLVYIIGCMAFGPSALNCARLFLLTNTVFNVGYLFEMRFGFFEGLVWRVVDGDGFWISVEFGRYR